MSLTDIKAKNQGFTIVELLIVVVVIAILAAITIVSYNGITGRANQAAVKGQAATYQKKAELYQSEVGNYPVATTDLSADSSKSYYYPSSTLVTFNASTSSLVNDTDMTKRLVIQKCAASGFTDDQADINSANITGLKINFYDPNKSGGAGVDSVSVGNAAVCPAS